MRLFNRKKQLYSSTIELLEKHNITTLRKRTKILLVDDDSDEIYQVLKERQYDIYFKSDMTYAIETEPFEIVIMDIRGVARRLQSSMEGFALACEVKMKYPLKRVCCYSGSIYPEISEQLAEKRIDAFWVKDTEIDKICEKIDKMIIDYADYNKQWEILQHEMIKNQVGESDIQQIREAYFNGFKKGNIIDLNTVIMETLKNSATMLNITGSVLNLIKILAV